MKAFKKWWKNKKFVGFHNKKLSVDEYFDHKSSHDISKHVWRASMEQVMRWGMKHYGNDFLSMDLCKDIKKELEEE